MKSQTSSSTPLEFWEHRYRNSSAKTSGKPTLALSLFVPALSPGSALELGCAKGDDAIWLAKQGWRATGVDISETALEYASDNAARNNVDVHFEQHELGKSFPKGKFDLVLANYLHSPFDWPLDKIFSQAAGAVVIGGHILVVEHASRAPWSWSPEGAFYPTAEDRLEALSLDEECWHRLCVCRISRMATGPKGQTATVMDNVIFVRRIV